MKNWILLPVMLMASISCFGQTAKAESPGKSLVIYYSRTNVTQQVAGEIQTVANADVFRIELAKPYPDDYHQCTEVAKEEKAANARPEIANKIENIDQYDTIFIGFPIWWSSRPMVIATLLESYDLKGKNIAPFCTHGGGGVGQAFNEVATHTPGSVHLEGLALTSAEASDSRQRVQQWIDSILSLK